MKILLVTILAVLIGTTGMAFGQSINEMYKVVKKAELKATGTQQDIDNSIADARTEYDLFKDSKEAKKYPEFTKFIENAITALRKAQFAKEVTKNPNDWEKNLKLAGNELEKAKQFLK
jgi:hypothetical protein